MTPRFPKRHSTIERLQDELALQAATIEELRAEGHVTTDAEKQLRSFRAALDLLK